MKITCGSLILSTMFGAMLLVAVGCDSIFLVDCNQSQNLPVWMGSVKDYFEIDQNAIQIELDVAEIWQPGDEDVALSLAIGESLEIQLDEILVPEEDIISLGGDVFLTKVHDEEGNYLGSYRNGLFIYIDTSSNIEFEFVTIRFENSSGDIFEHTWKYR